MNLRWVLKLVSTTTSDQIQNQAVALCMTGTMTESINNNNINVEKASSILLYLCTATHKQQRSTVKHCFILHKWHNLIYLSYLYHFTQHIINYYHGYICECYLPKDRDTENNCWAIILPHVVSEDVTDVTFKAFVLKLIMIRCINKAKDKEDNMIAGGCLLIVFDCTFMLL